MMTTTNNDEKRTPGPSIPNGTRVLSMADGEPGWIVNGFAYDTTTGEWTQYEVETAYGVERWERDAFVLMSEIETKS